MSLLPLPIHPTNYRVLWKLQLLLWVKTSGTGHCLISFLSMGFEQLPVPAIVWEKRPFDSGSNIINKEFVSFSLFLFHCRLLLNSSKYWKDKWCKYSSKCTYWIKYLNPGRLKLKLFQNSKQGLAYLFSYYKSTLTNWLGSNSCFMLSQFWIVRETK